MDWMQSYHRQSFRSPNMKMLRLETLSDKNSFFFCSFLDGVANPGPPFFRYRGRNGSQRQLPRWN